MNSVHLMGNLTRDVEIRNAGSSQVGNFGLAINRKWKDKDGQQQEDVVFVDCEAWGRTAEVIAQYHGKGDRILVEGRLKFDSWEDKNGGGKRSKLSVVVERFHFAKSGGEGGGSQASTTHGGADIDPTDIPF